MFLDSPRRAQRAQRKQLNWSYSAPSAPSAVNLPFWDRSQISLQPAAIEFVDELFDFALLRAIGDEEAVAVLHDDQILDAERADDVGVVADDDAVAGVDAGVAREDRVARRVLRVQALEREP